MVSSNFTFIFERQIKDIDQSDNSFFRVLGFHVYRFRELGTDWSVENINPDVSLDVRKNKNDTTKI